MKIAYKALHYQVLCEKEELLYQVDKLVEENIKLRDRFEEIRIVSGVAVIVAVVEALTLILIK